jgi:hypothetical protein
MTTTDVAIVGQQAIVEQFDYSLVDPGVAGFVQKRKANMIQRSIVSVIADGHDLLAIRQALGTDKLFRDWVEAEYWFSYQTAQKRMHVAEMVDDNSRGKLSLLQQYENKKVSELYELAAAYRRPQIEEKYKYETSVNGLADNLEGALNDQNVLEDLDSTEQPDQSNGVQSNENTSEVIPDQSAPTQETIQSETRPKGHGGGGHPDGKLPNFYQIPTLPPVRTNGYTYVWKELLPIGEYGRRFYKAIQKEYPGGMAEKAIGFAVYEEDLPLDAQAQISVPKKRK